MSSEFSVYSALEVFFWFTLFTVNVTPYKELFSSLYTKFPFCDYTGKHKVFTKRSKDTLKHNPSLATQISLYLNQ